MKSDKQLFKEKNLSKEYIKYLNFLKQKHPEVYKTELLRVKKINSQTEWSVVNTTNSYNKYNCSTKGITK